MKKLFSLFFILGAFSLVVNANVSRAEDDCEDCGEKEAVQKQFDQEAELKRIAEVKEFKDKQLKDFQARMGSSGSLSGPIPGKRINFRISNICGPADATTITEQTSGYMKNAPGILELGDHGFSSEQMNSLELYTGASENPEAVAVMNLGIVDLSATGSILPTLASPYPISFPSGGSIEKSNDREENGFHIPGRKGKKGASTRVRTKCIGVYGSLDVSKAFFDRLPADANGSRDSIQGLAINIEFADGEIKSGVVYICNKKESDNCVGSFPIQF